MASKKFITGLWPSKSLDHTSTLQIQNQIDKLKRISADDITVARELIDLADAVRSTDFSLAIAALTHALEIAEKYPSPDPIVETLAKRSWARYWRGETHPAFQDALRAEQMARTGVAPAELYRALFMSAKMHACLGKFARADVLWQEAIGVSRELKSLVREADCFFEHAFVQSAQGEFEKSLDNRLHAHLLLTSLGDESALRYGYANVAEGYADLGRHAIALDWAGQTILCDGDVTMEERACQLHVKGRCLVDLERVTEARAALEEALTLATLPAAKELAVAALIHAELARVSYLERKPFEAQDHYQHTLAHVNHWSDAMVCMSVIQGLGRLKQLRPAAGGDPLIDGIERGFNDAMTAILALPGV